MKKFLNGLAHLAYRVKKQGERHGFDGDDDFMYADVLDPFELDIKKITESKAYRRLKDKTQVFCFPENPHVRTRLSHTLEVVSLSTILARILGLNVRLCQAIAHGHDIGHAPYGHMGEEFIAKASGRPFRHELFGVKIAQKIERRGLGLNLTDVVLEGIRRHSRGGDKLTAAQGVPQEFNLVMFADKISYTLSDVQDALRFGILKENDLPAAAMALGNTQRHRTATCVFALAEESCNAGALSFSKSSTAETFSELRRWMFDHVYTRINWNIQHETLSIAYEVFEREPLFREFGAALPLALMTDREANKMTSIVITATRPSLRDMVNFGFMEILPFLRMHGSDLLDLK